MTLGSPSITGPERSLFAVYAATGSLKQAADQLGISEDAAKSRLRRLYRRNQVANAVQMAYLLWGIQRVVSPRETTPEASPP